jgi:outer membrane protein
MRLAFVFACALFSSGPLLLAGSALPTYTVEEAVALAQKQNPDIAVARKRLEAARGGLITARSGYLPSVVSSGIYRKRKQQEATSLRSNDYNASVRVVENLYTAGAVKSETAIARLNVQKQEAELDSAVERVTMEVRVAFYELLMNRAKVEVQQQALDVLSEELKTQQQRLNVGTVGVLNVRRAEVALANQQPELINAQTQVRLSYLRLGELLGIDSRTSNGEAPFKIVGRLQYEPRHPDLHECLARAVVQRPEIISRKIDIAIEENQLALDRSALRPQVQVFSGYEVYNERDPSLGRELNHGYVLGVNASWNIFDGFATKGRVAATSARRAAAVQALEATKLSIESEVRGVFLDLEQSDRVLQAETKNVQTADESLQLAKGNLATGLGTQLDVLQAAADVTRTRSTRLAAIYLHNAALARLNRACGEDETARAFDEKATRMTDPDRARAEQQLLLITRPPADLRERK